MMLTCEDVNDFLVRYLEDDLPETLRRGFESHVEKCSVCSTYLSQYRETIKLTRESTDLESEPPEPLIEMTLEFLRQHWGDERGA